MIIVFSKSAGGRVHLLINLLLLGVLIAGLNQPIFNLFSGNPMFGVGTDYLVFGIAVDHRLGFSACVASSLVEVVLIKEIRLSL